MVNPAAVKTTFPGPTHPCAIPEDSAQKGSTNKLARSKHAAGEEAGFKPSAVPLTFEQGGSAIDGIGTELYSNVQLTAL
jgi:hypothetical protein